MTLLIAACAAALAQTIDGPPARLTVGASQSVRDSSSRTHGNIVAPSLYPPSSIPSHAAVKCSSVPRPELNASGVAGTPVAGASTAPVSTKTWIRTVTGVPHPGEVVWDAEHRALYISSLTVQGASTTTLTAVDPIAGKAATPINAGHNPDLLALSSDDRYLWVSLDGDFAIQRFLLPGLTKDILVPLPKDVQGNGQAAFSLQAAPVNPHTVAVIPSNGEVGNGVFIYDDDIQRPTFISGWTAAGPPPAEIDYIQWGQDDSTLYGTYSYIDVEGGISILQVSSAGVTIERPPQGITMATLSQYDRGNGLLYSWNGVYDPVQNSLLGWFDGARSPDSACTADSSTGRFYCVGQVSSGLNTMVEMELWAYDLASGALIERGSLGYTGAADELISGTPWRLIRWGNAGLALITYPISDDSNDGAVFLIDGAMVNPNVAPDSTSGTALTYAPALTAISPSTSLTGGATELIIYGRNFSTNSLVHLNLYGDQASATPHAGLIDSNRLRITVPQQYMQTPGNTTITVGDTTTGMLSAQELVLSVSPWTITSQVTPLNLAALSMAWDDKSQVLYVGTSSADPNYPNSIVEFNGTTGTIQGSRTYFGDPAFLSISAVENSPNRLPIPVRDGANQPDVIGVGIHPEFGKEQRSLYVGSLESSSLSQLRLPDLCVEASWPLNTPDLSGPFFPLDVKAAPVDPYATAVTLTNPSLQPHAAGLAVYDGATVRSKMIPGRLQNGYSEVSYGEVAWGKNDSSLIAAEDGGILSLLAVDPSGLSVADLNLGYNGAKSKLHTDFSTGLVYTDDGGVIDPARDLVENYRTASGLVATDPSLNRVFILFSWTSASKETEYNIESFDKTTGVGVSEITLPPLYGTPIEMARWGTSGLAVATLNQSNLGPPGMLYMIQDPIFVSNATPSTSSQTSKWQARSTWKPLSKADIRLIVERRRRAK